MQTEIIITAALLNVMGFIGICAGNRNFPANAKVTINKVILPGAVLGATLFLLIFRPVTPFCVIAGALFGMLTAQLKSLIFLNFKRESKSRKTGYKFNDGTPPKYYITGDRHRNFEDIKEFCADMKTKKNDVLIILGDAGFNYYGDYRDIELKREISKLNITLFCLHGNKENRPQNVGTYGIKNFCGGKVYYEPAFDGIYFAVDGEVYNFDGKKYMVIGGAHSVDKLRCLKGGKPFWYDEMPNISIKSKAEANLKAENFSIYGMLTHTCPFKYLPNEMFISTAQNARIKKGINIKKVKQKNTFTPDIDRSTEEWLEKIERRLDYTVWYCGHYHVDKQLDKIIMMHREIRPLDLHLFGKEQ